MSSPVKTPNFCLRCWHYVHGKCVKTKDDYCKITKSK